MFYIPPKCVLLINFLSSFACLFKFPFCFLSFSFCSFDFILLCFLYFVCSDFYHPYGLFWGIFIILSASSYSIDPSSVCLSISCIFLLNSFHPFVLLIFHFLVKVFFLGLLIFMFVISVLWSVSFLLLPQTFFPPSSSIIVYVTFWAMYLVVSI